ncbi:MAG TPA: hypothetical protein VJR06_02500 [Nitrososphaerales archaeon]|nr:hypothetical protein [Nitrososphaerales archaeon]
MRRSASFPYLRVFGGALFVLAGALAYFRIGFGASAILLLVVGGVVVLVAALLGHRARPLDVTVFILGMLVLGAVSIGYAPGFQTTSYYATRDQVHSNAISIDVSSSASSISLVFTNRTDFAYQVNFTKPSWSNSFAGSGPDTVTNSTVGGVFHLDVSSTWSSVSMLLGKGYSFDVEATTGTGSIDMQAPGVMLGNVTLHSSTGSVDAVIDAPAIQSLELQADTGSVNLVSHVLGAARASVPVTLTTSTGSISVSLDIASQNAVSLTATTSLGSVGHSLSGFTINQSTNTNLVASAGNVQTAPKSFDITAVASLGSIDLDIGFV